MHEKVKFEISIVTILKVVLTLVTVYLLYLIKDVLVVLFIAFILIAALHPVVRSWSRYIGRVPAVLLLVILGLGIITGFGYLIVPAFATQIGQLFDSFPALVDKAHLLKQYFPSLQQNLQTLTSGVSSVTGSVVKITFSVIGGIAAFIMILFITIYALLDEAVFTKSLTALVPANIKDTVVDVVRKVFVKIGDWLRGQLFLGLVMGVMAYVAYYLIGLPYALTLAVIAGLTEILPVVGPIIAGVLALLVASQISWLAVILVLVVTVVMHQLESNLLVPKIMQKAIGLPPVIILVAILIGTKLIGVLGALLAVPIVGILYVLIQEWPTIKKITQNAE